MKRLLVSATLLIVTACAPAQKTEPKTAYSGRTFDSLQHEGNLALKQVTVTEALTGSGDLSAEETQFGSLVWKGPVKLDKSKVKNAVTVEGDSVALKETDVDGNLEVKGTDKGQTTLDRVTVKGSVIGNGTLQVTKGRIGAFDWQGSATLTECHVAKDSLFTGPLNLDTCTFAGNITATSTVIHLKGVQISGNLLIPETGKDEAQTVVLTGKSIVRGNITFASGTGIVKKEDDSTVGGKVVGALVER